MLKSPAFSAREQIDDDVGHFVANLARKPGFYHHRTGTTIEYNFSSAKSRSGIEKKIMVIWDGNIVSERGSLTLSRDSLLAAWVVDPLANSMKDEQGTWQFTEWDNDGKIHHHWITFERYTPWPGWGTAYLYDENHVRRFTDLRNYYFEVNADNRVTVLRWKYQLGERTDLNYTALYLSDDRAIGFASCSYYNYINCWMMQR